MSAKQYLSALAVVSLMSAPAFAQLTLPTMPARPAVTAPTMPTPTMPTMPTLAPPTAGPVSPATAAVTPGMKRTNLNTATAAQLDALPDVGKARSKAILDERAKGNFKDWADFDRRTTGTSLNAGVKAKIHDLVTF